MKENIENEDESREAKSEDEDGDVRMQRGTHIVRMKRDTRIFFCIVLLARLVTENLYFFSRIFSLRLKKMALLTHQVEEEYSKGEELLISILKGIKYVCCLALYNLTGSV